MAAKRPPGRREETAEGADVVACEVEETEEAEEAHAERARAGRPRDDASGVDPDLLDERDARQSADRKPAGPKGRRTTAEDVVIDTTPPDEVPPTDPR